MELLLLLLLLLLIRRRRSIIEGILRDRTGGKERGREVLLLQEVGDLEEEVSSSSGEMMGKVGRGELARSRGEAFGGKLS